MANGPDFVFYTDRTAAGRYYVRSRIGNIVGVSTVLKTLVDAVKANDVWLQFTAGLFDFGTIAVTGDKTNFVDLDGITIAGEGEGATTLQNTSNLADDTEVVNCTRCGGFTLRDFTVAALGTARSTSDALDFDDGDGITVERVTITASRGSGLAFDGKDPGASSSGHTVRDLTITGTNYEAILCWAVQRSVFDNLRLSGFGQTASAQGLKFNRHSGGLCSYNTVRGGIFVGGQFPIAVYAGVGNVIDGAICSGASSDGIRLQTFSDGFAGLDNTLIGVRTIGNGGFGVRILEDAAAQMVATRIVNHTSSGDASGALSDGGTATQIAGHIRTVREVATTTTLTATDPRGVVNVDTSGGTVPITLPTAAAAAGRTFVLRREGANTATVTRAGTDTFSDGNTVQTLNSDGAVLSIFSVGDGTWKIASVEGSVVGS